MPRYIIKPNRNTDLYVEWSTVVDNVTRTGTRAECASAGIDTAALDRADDTGTSATARPFPGAWDDPGWIVMNTDTVPSPRWLPRARLAGYALALTDDRVAEAEALTEPMPEQ